MDIVLEADQEARMEVEENNKTGSASEPTAGAQDIEMGEAAAPTVDVVVSGCRSSDTVLEDRPIVPEDGGGAPPIGLVGSDAQAGNVSEYAATMVSLDAAAQLDLTAAQGPDRQADAVAEAASQRQEMEQRLRVQEKRAVEFESQAAEGKARAERMAMEAACAQAAEAQARVEAAEKRAAEAEARAEAAEAARALEASELLESAAASTEVTPTYRGPKQHEHFPPGSRPAVRRQLQLPGGLHSPNPAAHDDRPASLVQPSARQSSLHSALAVISPTGDGNVLQQRARESIKLFATAPVGRLRQRFGPFGERPKIERSAAVTADANLEQILQKQQTILALIEKRQVHRQSVAHGWG